MAFKFIAFQHFLLCLPLIFSVLDNFSRQNGEFQEEKNKGFLVICLFVYRLMDCQVFGCKLNSFTFCQLQLCQTLMVMTHHT